MPLPVANDHSPDVLEAHEPHARPVRPVPWRLVCAVLAVALAAGAAVVAVQDDRPSVVDASGSMVLHDQVSRLVRVPHSTQEEGRDAVWTGSIQLELPDQQLDGEVVQHFSWAGTEVDGIIMISHNWGELDVTFGSTRCSGSFAWSAYREPRETSGALHLRCDDGSLFAATARLERDEEATADHPFRILMSLEDGSYVAG